MNWTKWGEAMRFMTCDAGNFDEQGKSLMVKWGRKWIDEGKI